MKPSFRFSHIVFYLLLLPLAMLYSCQRKPQRLWLLGNAEYRKASDKTDNDIQVLIKRG